MMFDLPETPIEPDLLFPCESEYPLELLPWESATLTAEIILTRSHLVTLSTDWGAKIQMLLLLRIS